MENVIEDLIENNKLIAEFMGGERHWLNGGIEPFTNDTIWGYYNIGENIQSTYSGRKIALVSDLKYHTSFDWLMPCCKKFSDMILTEKIELDATGKELWDLIESAILLFNITATHNYFSQIIKWYNLQNK